METYDDVYRKPEFYWGREPNELCELTVETYGADGVGKQPTVVDLGCGEGKDLIHFAKHGFRGIGIDISQPGLEKAQTWAREEDLPLQTVQASLNAWRLSDMVDVVYSSGSLTYIAPHLRNEVFENYKKHTNVGGLNVFNAFVEKPFIERPPDWGADEYFYRSGDLLRFYWDWEIVLFEEFTFDCTSSGIPHQHTMDVLIAKKVG